MRIAYLANRFNVGGAEQLNLEIVRHLHGRGFMFTFLLLKQEGSPAGALIQLLQEDDWRPELGHRTRRRIVERFTLDRAVREYADYFRRMVDPRCDTFVLAGGS